MFKAYLNNILFYDDTRSAESLALTEAKLKLKAGSAGSFEFSVPPSNVKYDSFEKLTGYVDVYRGRELVFSGRVYSETKDFQGISDVVCEGLLAVFNDSILRPGTYNVTLPNLISAFVASHNEQVGVDKQITVGTISVEDDYVYREYENYETTMTRLTDLVDSYGGYMSVTKTDSGLVFDWIASIETEATQTIDLGTNLTDLSQESTADDLFSVIIPLGKEIEDDDGNKAKLTIETVPTTTGHTIGTDYIEDADAITEMGRIVKVVEWSDVTDPTNLYNKAYAYLTDQSRSRVSISVSAVDMAKAGSTIDAWKIAQKIKVNASLFGISGVFLDVLEQNLDLQNPASNTMTLGSTKVGYIAKSNTKSNEITKEVNSANNTAKEALKSVAGEPEIYYVSEEPTFDNEPVAQWVRLYPHDDPEDLFPSDDLMMINYIDDYLLHNRCIAFDQANKQVYRLVKVNGEWTWKLLDGTEASEVLLKILGNTESIDNLTGDVNKRLTEITSIVEENSTWIGNSSTEIELGAKKVVESYSYGERISSIENSAVMQIDPEKITQTITKVVGDEDSDASLTTWMQFDSDGLTIGKSNSAIKSVQDNDSYEFIDNNSGRTLLEVNTEGIDAETVATKAQFKLKNGEVDQWTIRNGLSVNGHANLNFVWVGGDI